VRKVLIVARRDFVETVKNRGFLIGMIMVPVMFSVMFFLVGLINNQNTKDQHIAIVDRTGVAAETVIRQAEEQNKKDLFDGLSGKQVMPQYIFENVRPQADADAQRLALSDRVRAGELNLIIEIGAKVIEGVPEPEQAPCLLGVDCPPSPLEDRVTYFGAGNGADQLRRWFDGPIISGIRQVRLSQAGVSDAGVERVLSGISFERLGLATRDAATGEIRRARRNNQIENFIIPFALVMIMMMVVLMGSAPMLAAIAQDKMERVFEMMLVSATPMQIMAGKVLAAMALSVTSSIFYIVAGIFALQAAALFGLVPFALLPWFFVYLVASVLMLAAMGAGLGSACSTPQDAQSLAGFLIFPIVIPSMLTAAILQQPNGTLATVVSLIPPATPMLMLLRQAMPTPIPAWQPWVGLIGILLWTLAIVWGASRVFRIGILMQGKPPHIGEILRWALKG